MISIIIPTLNEENQIEDIIDHVCLVASGKYPLELIIVDGGSADNTTEIVSKLINKTTFPLQLCKSDKGRAKQMNYGAVKASGEIFYFLHADTFPPTNFDEYIMEAVSNGRSAGSFRLRFDSKHPVLKFSQWFTRFNFKFCRGGDQSLFVRKDIFNDLAGFNKEYRIYEDCEFINRLYDNYDFVVLKAQVVTSARTYNTIGAWKLQYYFTVIHLKKWFGATPQQLYEYYRKKISSKAI